LKVDMAHQKIRSIMTEVAAFVEESMKNKT
jgi:hypothetical protein